jgi:hypothetical protein
MKIIRRGDDSLSDKNEWGEAIPETLKAVSVLRTKKRRGKKEDTAGEEIRILLTSTGPSDTRDQCTHNGWTVIHSCHPKPATGHTAFQFIYFDKILLLFVSAIADHVVSAV